MKLGHKPCIFSHPSHISRYLSKVLRSLLGHTRLCLACSETSARWTSRFDKKMQLTFLVISYQFPDDITKFPWILAFYLRLFWMLDKNQFTSHEQIAANYWARFCGAQWALSCFSPPRLKVLNFWQNTVIWSIIIVPLFFQNNNFFNIVLFIETMANYIIFILRCTVFKMSN